jgi:hypothetical protein
VGALSAGTFTLLTFGQSANIGATDFTALGLGSDWLSTFAFNPATGGQAGSLTVTLSQANIVSAPEPGSVLLLLVAGVPVGLLVRRKGKV